jgi:type II secretory pathway pseudopilin PulG
MKNPRLFKYQVGLAVIGLLSFVLLIVVAVKADAVKQDRQTYKAADKVATRLDNYVNDKNRVPNSLEGAGIMDVPDNVDYQKLSTTRYKFCVTYRTDSGKGSDYLLMQLLTGGQANDYYTDNSNYDSYGLYLEERHHKGENCNYVKTYVDDYNDSNSQTDYDTQSL